MKRLLYTILITAAGTFTAKGASDNLSSLRDTITDPNIVYPESFEADTHRMMQNWYLQNYAVLDRNADNVENVPASDETLIERLMAMPTVVEMPFNSVVKSYINMYVDRRRSLVENMLGMSLYYMPIFEEALEQEGVPLELKYLPIIESALNPNAVSRAGATGLWQFMLPTARGLGLEINSLVDERRDPVMSSRMAARYLRQLHDMYDDWSLAIAAYNCGPGNVNKALRRAGEGKKDFWEIYPYLPQETRGYLPGFIAANYAMNYYDKHNISPALARRPIITDTIHVTRRVHLQQIADVLGMPVDEIRLLNPQYREDIIPGDVRPYALTLPSHQTLAYVISEDSIVAHNAALYARRGVVEPADGNSRVSEDGNYIITEVVKYHKVRKGETFASIAKKYGVTASSIKRANGIKTLRRGRTIKIITTKKTPRPAEETTPETTTEPLDQAEEVVPATYDSETREQPEDDDPAAENDDEEAEDEAEVAEREAEEDAEVEAAVAVVAPAVPASAPIASANVPQAAPATPAAQPAPATSTRQGQHQEMPKQKKDKAEYYKVRRGDNLSKIARRYGTTVQKLQQLNPSIHGTQVNIGQRIRVK